MNFEEREEVKEEGGRCFGEREGLFDVLVVGNFEEMRRGKLPIK